jgi:hypothetical protein
MFKNHNLRYIQETKGRISNNTEWGIQSKLDSTLGQGFSLKEVSALPTAETPLFYAFPGERGRVKAARVGQGSAIWKPWIREMLEPMTIGDLDIWSDVVEKVHHHLEIVRRNQERISIWLVRNTAQKRSHSSLRSSGLIQRPAEELTVIMLFRRVVVYFGFFRMWNIGLSDVKYLSRHYSLRHILKA